MTWWVGLTLFIVGTTFGLAIGYCWGTDVERNRR